jgi:8-oxo-dGTP pyrophosphatase MutT (NUDIX family)
MKQLSLLYLLKDDQILLAMKKRGFGSGLLNGVGGKQAGNESIEETAIRECEEEVGVTPVSLQKVAELVFIDYSGEESLVHVYLCYEWKGEPVESEEMRPEWYRIKEIPYDLMWPDDEHWLPSVLNGEKVSGKFVFDQNNNLVDWQTNVVALI